MKELKTTYLVRFTRRTGKIDKTMSALGNALLRLWALQNTTANSKDTIIFDEDGWVLWYYEGTGDFPKIIDVHGEQHIDEYCEGLLEELQTQTEKEAEK